MVTSLGLCVKWSLVPMLDWCMRECMVSIINIFNMIKEPTIHVGINIVIPINIDVWWVCQGERVCMPELLYESF